MGFAEILLQYQVALGDDNQPAVLGVGAFDGAVGLFELIHVYAGESAGFRLVLRRAPAALSVGGRKVVGGARREGEEGEEKDELHWDERKMEDGG